MKGFLLLLLCISLHYSATGQNSVRVYAGANLTNLHEESIGNIVYKDLKTSVLPNIGFDFRVALPKGFALSTGLGVSMMGANNFNEGLDTIPNAGLKEDLRVSFLSSPAKLEYRILKWFSVYGGYELKYSIRKNQDFFWVDAGQDYISLRSIYPIFHHSAILGATVHIQNIDFSINYNRGLSNFYDTRGYALYRYGFRSYAKMHGFQISLGYVFHDHPDE